MGSRNTSQLAALEALERAGFDVKNRATGEPPPVIPTPWPELNNVLKCGGIPRRRYTQITGEPQHCKSLFAMHIIAAALQQEPERLAILFDTENTFNSEWAKLNGIDVSKIYLIQGNTAERVYENALKAMQTGQVGIVVIDTIGQMLEQRGKDASFVDDSKKRKVGDFQQLLGRFAKTASDLMQEHNIAVVGVNHTYTNIGVTYGNPLVAPGGRAWRFNLTCDIELRKVKMITSFEGADPIGVLVAVNVTKNKLGAQARTDDSTHIKVYFGEDGIRRGQIDSLIDEAIRKGIINATGKGAWLTWEDANGKTIKKWQGQARMKFDILNDQELADQLDAHVNGLSDNKPISPEPTVRRSRTRVSG